MASVPCSGMRAANNRRVLIGTERALPAIDGKRYFAARTQASEGRQLLSPPMAKMRALAAC